MLGAGIDPQIAELDPRQRAARQHALDRLLDDALRELALEDRTRGALFNPADIARVVTVDLVLALAPGEHDLVSVHDDNIVAVIDVGRVGGLVLAAQAHRDDGREPADHETSGVDHHPLLLDLGRFGRKSLHGWVFQIFGSGRCTSTCVGAADTPAAGARSTPALI